MAVNLTAGAERLVSVGSLELACEAFGDPGDAPILLVMGLGTQMINWDEEFCTRLAGRGFHVIRFDNRDVGRSSQIDPAPTPDLQSLAAGDLSTLAYSLEDMAGDAAGLLDALGIEAAHVVGVSMGGMIAQLLAVGPGTRQKVLSLASIMSTTGDRSLGQARPEALELLLTPSPTDLDAYMERALRASRVIGSPGFPGDPDRIRARARRAHERGLWPAGVARQLAAVVAAGDRTVALEAVGVPTVVIHGEDDPLVDMSGGQATAAAIAGARLVTISGMGHDLPPEVWPQVIDALVDNAARAEPVAGVRPPARPHEA
jgi:pimeloyl-ACP methyl ester carboxylesterase